MIRKGKRFVLDLIQVFGILGIFIFFQLLSFKRGSQLAGFLGRHIGMRLPHRHRAYRNLRRAMPELSPQRQDQIIRGMFDNLARTIVEYVLFYRIRVYSSTSGIEVVGQDIIDQLRDDQKPAIFFLAHLANWEMGTLVALQKGLKITQVYRKLNYPLTDRLIHWVHRQTAQNVVTKGSTGTRQMMAALNRGDHISMLSDQKMNEGEWIPFFGIPAKTASGGARLALKYDCPFVPVRVERLPNAKFRVTYYPPLVSTKTTSTDQVIDLLTQMNQLIEQWIRARPEQWFWLHHRWPKGYKSLDA